MNAKLPQELRWEDADNRWGAIIQPFLDRVTNQANILPKVKLVVGENVINHRLGRKLTGWSVIRQRGPAAIYDNQDENQRPELTLILVSDAEVIVDIEVC